MTIKKLFIALCCMMYSSISFSQTAKSTIHELGLSINSGIYFGLVYKVGTPKDLFRIRTLLLNGNHLLGAQVISYSTTSDNVGLNIGYERRAKIINNLSFVYGFDLGFGFGSTSSQQYNYWQKTESITPSINFVLGLNYVLKEHWIFSFETLPYFGYQIMGVTRIDSTSNTYEQEHHVLYGFNLSSIQLVVAYRIISSKKEKQAE